MKTFTTTLAAIVVMLSASIVPALAQSLPQSSFESWLEKYGAWDQLEKQYAQEADKDTPDTILKRAEVYLNLNSPKEALEIIEMTPSFADNATEANRLWLGGRAQRALGDLSKSVLWFSQSAQFMNDSSEMKRRFKSEPGLDTIWKDVWLKLYWSYRANFTISRDSQQDALSRILDIGQNVWRDSFWEKANFALNPPSTQTDKAPSQQSKETVLDAPFITQKDMELVAQAMAAVSLERFDTAHGSVSQISQAPVRFFWSAIVDFMESGKNPTEFMELESGNFLKPLAFWKGNLLAPYSQSRSDWVLGNPDSGPWLTFRNNLLAMPADEARKAIDKELGSMLISAETAALLNSFKLALSMSNGDYIASTAIWNTVNKKELPLALKFAGTLLFKDYLKTVLPESHAKSFEIFPILTALSGAAGRDLNGVYEAPFWLSAPSGNLESLSGRTYPMDKLLLLAYWQTAFSNRPSVDLAKRSAFLFNDTSFGISSMLYLSEQAVKNKNLQLGAFYLNRVAESSLDPLQKMKWLDVKVRLELESGRNDAALTTFKEMAALSGEVPVMTRLRIALLYQQRREFEAAREQLQTLWANRANLTSTLQAETLFWLGEGEQALRNTQKALDYYLRLAWQYPQENIWALTAMYRASIIYEQRGKYETAKNLLGTVVRRADTKEQREAAKARLNAIDRKMGKESKSDSNTTLVYPF